MALRFHRALTLLTLRHRNVSYFLVWAPVDEELAGFNMARDAAKEASWGLPPDGIDRIQSAAFQKDRARRKAFQDWENEFGLEQCLAQFRLNVTGHAGEGHAYSERIIVDPYSVSHHPLWAAATDMERDEHGKKTRRPRYSRRVTLAAFQLAVDCALTGSYAHRFRPADPPETTTCPCRANYRTPTHLIRECPLYLRPRINHGIHNHMRTLSLAQLHHTIPRAHELLKYIAKGKIAFRPPDFPPNSPVPPDPN